MDTSRLRGLKREDFVTFRGYPTDEKSRWHVNKVIHVGSGSKPKLMALALQIESADPHWLMIVLDEGEVRTMAASRDEPPSGVEMEDHAEHIDPEQVEVVSVEAT